MKTRIEDVPRLRSDRTAIEATRFNLVRLALLRLGGPIRLSLPGLRGMDLVVDRERWVCVDRGLYDLPILAWTDFSVRHGLHTPVDCRRHYYHIHADLISETVLSTMTTLLGQRLAATPVTPERRVLTLERRRPHRRASA